MASPPLEGLAVGFLERLRAVCCICKDDVNNSTDAATDVVFFRFPESLEWRHKWLHALKNFPIYSFLVQLNAAVTTDLYLCSTHFNKEDYFFNGMYRLKQNAVPSKFLRGQSDGPPPLIPIYPENSCGVSCESDCAPDLEAFETESINSSSSVLASLLRQLDSPEMVESVPSVQEADKESSESIALDYQDFYATAAAPHNSKEKDVEPETALSDRVQFLFENPLLLQDLVIEEKARCFDQEIDLTFPTDKKCQMVLWTRLQRAYHSDRFCMRLTKRADEAVVLLMSWANVARFSTISTDVKQVTNWNGVPPFVQELISPFNSSDESAKYAFLLYDGYHGWELAGYTATSHSVPIAEEEQELNDVETAEQQLEDHLDQVEEVKPIITYVPLPMLPVVAPLTAPAPKTWNTMIPMDALELSQLETAAKGVVSKASVDKGVQLEKKLKTSKKKRKSNPNRSYKTCPTCDKEILASNFHKHEEMHDPTKQKLCPYCSFTAYRNDYIKSHIRREHSDLDAAQFFNPRSRRVSSLPTVTADTPPATSPSENELETPEPSHFPLLGQEGPSSSNQQEYTTIVSPSSPQDESFDKEPADSHVPSVQVPVPETSLIEKIVSPALPPDSSNVSSTEIQSSDMESSEAPEKEPQPDNRNVVNSKMKNKWNRFRRLVLYPCNQCDMAFKNQDSLNSHKLEHKPERSIKQKLLRCDCREYSTRQTDNLKKHVRSQHMDEITPEPVDRSRRITTLYSIPLDDTPRSSRSKSSREKANLPPTPPSSQPTKSTHPNMSEDWLCCSRCDYRSRRRDFFKIHEERAHISDDEESEPPPVKRRRMLVVSSSSSEDEALVANPISDHDEPPSTSKKVTMKTKESSVNTDDTASTSSQIVMQSVVIELPIEELSTISKAKIEKSPQRVQCQICQKKVLGPNMKRHLKLHDPNTVFRCTFCPLTSKRLDDLKAHIRRQHNQQNTDKLVAVVAKQPTKIAPSFSKRKRGNFPKECKLCKKMLYTEGTYTAHRKSHDPSKYKRCTRCNYATIYGTNFKRHVAKCQGAAKDVEPTDLTASVSACTEVMLNNPAVITSDETALADFPSDDREPTHLQEQQRETPQILEETGGNFSISFDHCYSRPLSSQQLVTDESTSSNGLAVGSAPSPQMPTELGNDSLTSCETLNNVENQEAASSSTTTLEINVGSSKEKQSAFYKKCARCPKAFTSSYKYKTHLASHNKSNWFKCPHCDYASAYRDNFNKHMRFHLFKNPNIQLDQGASSPASATGTSSVKVPSHRTIQRAKSLVRALDEYSDDPLLSIERPNSPQKIIFSKQCDICSKVFLSEECFREHKRTHDPASWERCLHCDYASPYSGYVMKHMLSIHPLNDPSEQLFEQLVETDGIRKPTESLSPTSYSTTVLSLDATDTVYSAPTGSPGSIMAMPIQRRSEDHVKCIICDKEVLVKNLEKHLRIHDRPKVHCCYCLYVTRRPYRLKDHIQKIHPYKQMPESLQHVRKRKIKPFSRKCTQCDQTFVSKSSYGNHVYPEPVCIKKMEDQDPPLEKDLSQLEPVFTPQSPLISCSTVSQFAFDPYPCTTILTNMDMSVNESHAILIPQSPTLMPPPPESSTLSSAQTSSEDVKIDITAASSASRPKRKSPSVYQKCLTCRKEVRQANFSKHLAKHEVVNDPSKWKNCEFCDYITTHSDDLLFHKRRVHTDQLVAIKTPLLPPKTEEKPAAAENLLASSPDHASHTKVTQLQDEELATELMSRLSIR